MKRARQLIYVIGAGFVGILATMVSAEAISQVLPFEPIVWVIFGGVASLSFAISQTTEPTPPETLDDRIERLTSSLYENVRVISEIEQEIKKRHATVTQLKADHERYSKLKEMDATDVEAIAQQLEIVVAIESKRSFWKSVLVNFTFFILGSSVSAGITWWSL